VLGITNASDNSPGRNTTPAPSLWASGRGVCDSHQHAQTVWCLHYATSSLRFSASIEAIRHGPWRHSAPNLSEAGSIACEGNFFLRQLYADSPGSLLQDVEATGAALTSNDRHTVSCQLCGLESGVGLGLLRLTPMRAMALQLGLMLTFPGPRGFLLKRLWIPAGPVRLPRLICSVETLVCCPVVANPGLACS
jgi:hypothetical protein